MESVVNTAVRLITKKIKGAKLQFFILKWAGGGGVIVLKTGGTEQGLLGKLIPNVCIFPFKCELMPAPTHSAMLLKEGP